MSDLFGAQIEQVEFAAGEFLFHENDRGYHFFIIQEGEVEVFKTLESTKVSLAIIGAGNSIGEFAMIDRQPRSASAQVIKKVVATRVSEEAYQQLLNELPDWALSVMRGLVDRLRQANDLIRKHKMINPKLGGETEPLDYNSEITIIDESPFLNSEDLNTLKTRSTK